MIVEENEKRIISINYILEEFSKYVVLRCLFNRIALDNKSYGFTLVYEFEF